MTFVEAMGAQPTWVQIWLNWMLISVFILPLALFIWRETRLTALIIVLTHTLNGLTVIYLFNMLGYVKLLGLPHLIFWGPLLWYLLRFMRRETISLWATRILWLLIATLAISLAFDLTDTIRYLLGNTTPFPGTAPVT
ncbi:hypothetical protein [Amylibacter sp. IMCC11727]|uniref:hypothetical protein n=1 Tax=Amylibacter sp. IMCC11727 TaxID=3039851 RepID=UPI00244E1B0C|nr:hypothetical protein [Amylibacter sp. IMCC11727]WGI21730.1 hypothetical protein QBD29_16710 [Amylibacter sp. IMCC11727]